VFTDSYRETFANVGFQLRSEDGCASADIERAETRLGLKIPLSLKEYYLLSGGERRVNQSHNRLLPPGKWFTDSNHLVFIVFITRNNNFDSIGNRTAISLRPETINGAFLGADHDAAAADGRRAEDARIEFEAL
jgi:hypothetical protein